MASKVKKWFNETRCQGTKSRYKGIQKQYKVFCKEKGLRKRSGAALAGFMMLAAKVLKRARSTVTKTIPAAVADLFRGSSRNPANTKVVRMAKLAALKCTPPPKQKKPILVEHLRKMKPLVKGSFESVRNHTMLILMMYGMLRRSEAVALKWSDTWLSVVNSKLVLFLLVQKSKTDQGRKGHTIVLGEQTDISICPVKWFLIFSLFRRQLQAKRLFCTKKGEKLSKATPAKEIKAKLKEIGVDPKCYSSHSARRGGCTAALAAGVEKHVAARHGNWKSDAIFLYVVDTLAEKMSVANAIASSQLSAGSFLYTSKE